MPSAITARNSLNDLSVSSAGFFLDVFPALEDSGFAGNLRFLEILP